MAEHWHRHSGVYGIGVRDGKMPVIRKRRGPYAGRYDLPGGSAEPDETLAETLRREFREETGLGVHILRCLGAQDWVVPWREEVRGTTHLHHIAIFCEVACAEEAPARGVAESGGSEWLEPHNDDSAGAEWVEPGGLNAGNCSPLVMWAADWLRGKVDRAFEAVRPDQSGR